MWKSKLVVLGCTHGPRRAPPWTLPTCGAGFSRVGAVSLSIMMMDEDDDGRE
jgi:hypothetical protein